jgi:iron complex transport system ATP-binding protein
LLAVGDVSFAYARARGRGASAAAPFALERVTVRVPERAIVGVLGPNGSGKTSLLKLVAGALKPTSGHVWLDGVEISAMSRRDLARRLAVVPQETALAFDYTALEIVLMGRYPHLGAFEVEGARDLDAARAALDATGTAGLADRAFRTLSGGEKQRVVIASALAQLDGTNAPALLVLDEPTASLDLHYQLEVAALITRLHQARGITVLLSTHDLKLAATLCTEIVLLSRGRVLGQGSPGAVLTMASVASVFDVSEAQVREHLAPAWEPRVARPEPRVFRSGEDR